MNSLIDLVGKIINSVRMDPSYTAIQFDTDNGAIIYHTHADCCSESWINHMSGLQAIIGEKVLKTEEIEMSELTGNDAGFSGRQEVDKVYSYKVFTQNGICEFEMRNASNGYYGGFLWKTTEAVPDLKTIFYDF